GGRGEEGLQMLPDYSLQDRVDGSAWGVGSHGARPSGCRAVAATRPQDARTTSTPRSSRRQDETPGATERCGGPSPYGGGEDSARTSEIGDSVNVAKTPFVAPIFRSNYRPGERDCQCGPHMAGPLV